MSRGTRWKTTAWRGAARVAPTAPHATEASATAPGSRPAERSGPERFWSPRWVILTLAVGAVLSLAAHVAFFGRSLFEMDSLETREVDGGGMIPIDLFEGEDEPEPPPEEQPPTPPPPPDTPDPDTNAERAGLDAGRVRDAAAMDAAAVADLDAADLTGADADVSSAALDASARDLRDAAGSELVADSGVGGVGGTTGDAGMPDAGEPIAGVGPALAEDVLAGPPLVRLLVNMNEIRKNPVGAQLGPLMSAIPQWDDFMAGTKVDPVRDADWVTITGPSLLHTERDVIMVHYSAPDAVIDHAIDLIRQRSHNGAGFDAGVPGVKATLGHADRAPRVFLRPQPHVLAVTPPDFAETAARMLVKRKLAAHILAGEAMRLTVQHPHGPFPSLFPEEMSELRVWIVQRPDGGADVHGEGRCPDASVAEAATANAAGKLRQFKGSMAGIGANMLTHNAIDALTAPGRPRGHEPQARGPRDARSARSSARPRRRSAGSHPAAGRGSDAGRQACRCGGGALAPRPGAYAAVACPGA